MADVLDLLPDLRRRQAKRQELRLRVDRRARELAAIAQDRYFRAMLSDLAYGRLAEDLVPYWEPITGEVRAEHKARS